MKFLADECCDAPLVAALREDGHDVLFAAETLRGAIDEHIIQLAYTENRLLITEDKDFGELVFRLFKPTVGIILLRFDPQDRTTKIIRVRQLLSQYSVRLDGSFTVLDKTKLRIRPLVR